MAIQIGPYMPPCRQCQARPGEECTFAASDGRGPLRRRRYPNVHKVRERDAALMSELLDW